MPTNGTRVKEEVLTRLGELGLRIEDGRIVIRPLLLRDEEWGPAGTFTHRDATGKQQTINLPEASVAFTFCQVPVVLRRGDRLSVTAHLANGSSAVGADQVLDANTSASVFQRDDRVRLIELGRGQLRRPGPHPARRSAGSGGPGHPDRLQGRAPESADQ